MKKITISKKEQDFIEQNYLKMGAKTMAKILGIGSGRVVRFMKFKKYIVPDDLKIKFKHLNREFGSIISAYDDFIIENHLTMPVRTISQIIGVGSRQAVITRIRQLGLEIPVEIRQKHIRDSNFKKGKVPENKGKRMEDFMSPETIKKFRANQFKKGTIPPNTCKEDGTIRVRKMSNSNRRYKWIRISLANWKLYHHYLWETQNGPVPEGHCLWFINGDSLDVRLENLELITNEENMRRNSLVNYPEDIQDIIRLKGQISRQINKHDKKK